MKFSIFLITYKNDANDLENILNRLYKHTKQLYNLIIIDNNEDQNDKDNVYKLYNESPIVNKKLLMNGENLRACKSTNKALKLIDTEYAIYLCSRHSFIVNDSWENDCLDYMNNNKNVGIAGSSWELTDKYWNIVSKSLPLFRNKEWYKTQENFKFFHVQGGFYILRMKMFNEIGGFNEEAFEHNGMDFEYSYYAQSKGWDLGNLDFIQSYDQNIKKNLFNNKIKIYHPTIPKE